MAGLADSLHCIYFAITQQDLHRLTLCSTESAVTDANSRSIVARIIYVTDNEVTTGAAGTSAAAVSVTTIVYTVSTTVSEQSTTITDYFTNTDVVTLFPTLVPGNVSMTESPTIPPVVYTPSTTTVHSTLSANSTIGASSTVVVNSPSPALSPTASPTETAACLTDNDGFYTDDTGITYESRCNWWTNGDTIATFGPGYTAEMCLEACSMVFPGCIVALYANSDGGYCSLQSSGGDQWQVLFGYDLYERVTMHVGINSSQSPVAASSPSPDAFSTLTASPTNTLLSTEPGLPGGPTSVTATLEMISAVSNSTFISPGLKITPMPISALPSLQSSVGQCMPTAIPDVARVSCPDSNLQIFANASNSRYFEIACDQIYAAVEWTYINGLDIGGCANACYGACDAFQYGYSDCALYTSVTATASSSGYTLGTVVASPTQSECISTALTASSSTSPSTSLMSAVSTGAPCPGSNNSVYIDANERAYKVSCGHDLAADFMSAFYYVDNDEWCLELCDQTDGCVGAARTIPYYDACLMYSEIYDVGPSGSGYNAFVLLQPSSNASSSVATSATTTSTGPASTSVISCPGSDHSIYTDPSDGQTYQVHCESAFTSPGSEDLTHFTNIRGRYTFAECAAFCNSTACPGFVYSGTSDACGIYSDSVDGASSAVPGEATAVTLASAFTASSTPIPISSRISLEVASSVALSAEAPTVSENAIFPSSFSSQQSGFATATAYNNATSGVAFASSHTAASAPAAPSTVASLFSTTFTDAGVADVSSPATSPEAPSWSSSIESQMQPSPSVSSLLVPGSQSSGFATTTISSSVGTPANASTPSEAPLTCPQSNSTIYTAADGAQFLIGCNLDLKEGGYDLYRTVETTFQSCIDACDAAGPSSCQGVSWVPYGQSESYCYAKPGELRNRFLCFAKQILSRLESSFLP